jgi:hypothetical protein
MTFLQLVERHRRQILSKWVELAINTYPPDTASLLKSEADRFANPVGFVISYNLEKTFECLLQNREPGRFIPYLEEIIKIRAVQDFSPSQAVAFTWLLKKAITDELSSYFSGRQMDNQWLEFEGQIDRMVGQAFDIYSNCREKIYQIKMKEHAAESGVDKLFRGKTP